MTQLEAWMASVWRPISGKAPHLDRLIAERVLPAVQYQVAAIAVAPDDGEALRQRILRKLEAAVQGETLPADGAAV